MHITITEDERRLFNDWAKAFDFHDTAPEEFTEAALAIMHHRRGKATDAELVNELADVLISTMQIVTAELGGDHDLRWLLNVVTKKMDKFRARLKGASDE